jgi:hypothetical protein
LSVSLASGHQYHITAMPMNFPNKLGGLHIGMPHG